MRVIELFAGIGGFRLGLERSGHKIVWANEWLESPRRIYEKNFGEKPDASDIRSLSADVIPSADLICGGFPCATFSVAGKKTGLSECDTRGTLFFEICRIAEAKRVPYLFLENVKGLLNHDSGRTFAVMLFALDKLGYDVQWEVLNSRNFGVPQNRERIFIIASLRGQPRPKIFPIGEIKEANFREGGEDGAGGEGLQGEVASTIDAHYYKGGSTRTFIQEPERFRETKSSGDGKSSDGTPAQPSEKKAFVKPFLTPNREKKRQRGRRMKEDGEPAFTIGVQDRHGIAIGNTNEDMKIRKLTPLECERLQGFPDNFTKFYEDGTLVSDSERYERCGRTVSIPVIQAIGEKLGTSWYE